MGEYDHITTLASMLMGARGYRTSTECTVYDEERGREHPLASSIAAYRDGYFHIVSSESRLGDFERAARLSIYVIEQREFDPSWMPTTFPPETLVFEKVDGKVEVFIPGKWQSELESRIGISG